MAPGEASGEETALAMVQDGAGGPHSHRDP